ncbi:uncharacterized protein (DUF697 family) [Desulfobotulus alkaliphilus]|uniref:Uncharacterized protein (DUF697 family) n=1 Tax=Desulfobotulus alkaliphilus TaxID=622671 RepID=A0A562R6X4_9BACT|nr:GTPase [Desulfobotulus alkaliphilus]TWI64797.1 uncharacterized protein (DUF697 family) [Desulfobotulus alkaliphilus]
MGNFKEHIEKEFETQKKSVKKPNLMIVGGTGVGKSSLVNLVFGNDIAETGNGKPVTRGLHRYEASDIPIVIFDTEGYEYVDGKADNSNFFRAILPEIEKMQAQSLKYQIHLVWYCISVANHRITDYDLELIKLIQQRFTVKIAVVFTQCDKDEEKDGTGVTAEEFKKVLKENNIGNEIFETSTDEELQSELDLDKLMAWSVKSLTDEEMKKSFIAAQRLSLPMKVEEAYKVVGLATASAGGIAAVNPVPLSDAALLMPIQIAMIIKLANTFGFGSLGSHMVNLLKTQLLPVIGRQMVASITKFIPGLGNIINAIVASSLTGGVGLALITIYKKAYEKYINDGIEPDWEEIFSSNSFEYALKEGVKEWKKKN